MTQQEILDYNKLCAEFLGYVNTTPSDVVFSIYHNNNGFWIDSKQYTLLEPMSMKFHSDWNWIMEILDKIYSTKIYYSKYIPKNASQFEDGSIQITTKKEAVVEAINQFLIWYNENNKTN